MARIFYALIILMISTASLPAQVKFLLDYNARTGEYTVSMMPERTWTSPQNKTATGQVTIKATTGQLVVKDVVSHVEDTDWIPSGKVTSPMESPKYDYHFFRLKTPGLTEMPYRAFRPTKLFTFTIEANCAREVMLVSNKEDAFLPPNSRSVNIGNSIGALGANGEAYIGNISDLPIFCPYADPPKKDTETKIVETQPEIVPVIGKTVIYPNPTVNEVAISLNWLGTKGSKNIMAYNSAGELVRFFQQDFQEGANRFTLEISDFDNGVYNFQVVDDHQQLTLGKIIKVK
ncbi:MAG: T9SS type A sorting domain-containing protein [Bacteroidota bacterium]